MKTLVMLVLLTLLIWIILASLMMRNHIRGPKDKDKHFLKVNRLIDSSGIRERFKFYNVVYHLGISIGIFLITFNVARIRLGGFSSIIFCILTFFIPSLILAILRQNKVSQTRKATVDFIEIFSNQMNTCSNIFDAMKESVKYTKNPVKGVVQTGLEMYDKKIDPEKCISYISANLVGMEVKAFFENLKYYFIEGGDISDINDDFLGELEDIIEIDRKEDSEDQILNTWVYLIIGANLFGVGTVIMSDVSKLITQSMYGEIILSFNFALCIILIVNTLLKQGDLE